MGKKVENPRNAVATFWCVAGVGKSGHFCRVFLPFFFIFCSRFLRDALFPAACFFSGVFGVLKCRWRGGLPRRLECLIFGKIEFLMCRVYGGLFKNGMLGQPGSCFRSISREGSENQKCQNLKPPFLAFFSKIDIFPTSATHQGENGLFLPSKVLFLAFFGGVKKGRFSDFLSKPPW